MKLNRGILVAVAMMVGSASAIGCNSGNQGANGEAVDLGSLAPAAEPVKSEARVAAAPAAAAPAAGQEQVTIQAKASIGANTQPARYNPPPRYEAPRYHQPLYVPQAPPPPRRESAGRAPSHRHFWVAGHWKHDGARYTWVSGRWDAHRNGHTYNQPRYHKQHGKWVYVPGHWARTR